MNNQKNKLLLSSAYLPPVSYFAALLPFEEVHIEQHETYPKQTFRNRAEIYSEKGKMTLSVPVTKVHGNNTPTSKVKINNAQKWQLNHWRAIESAYLSSPYFLFYKDELSGFYSQTFEVLVDFNQALTSTLCHITGILTQMHLSLGYEHRPENTIDFRDKIHPKKLSVYINYPEYIQVFADRHGFIPNLSIVDLIFNLGPETKNYLKNLNRLNRFALHT